MRHIRLFALLLIVGSIVTAAALAATPAPSPATSPAPAGGCISVPGEEEAAFTPAEPVASDSPDASTGLLQFCKTKYRCHSQGQICNDNGCTCQHDGSRLRCAR